MVYIRSVAGVLEGDRADISVPVQIQRSVLVQITGLGDFAGAKLDIERVSILEIPDFHYLIVLPESPVRSFVEGWAISRFSVKRDRDSLVPKNPAAQQITVSCIFCS